MNNNLFKYFKREASLPSLSGPLSQKMPSSMIQAANDSVSSVVSTAGDGSDGKKRGPYVKLSSEDKARIANYAVTHGTSAAIRHFQTEFPYLKWTTVNDWKTAMTAKMKQAHSSGKFEPIKLLEGKKTGRPSALSDELTKELKLYIEVIREGGGVINTAIVIAAATGMLQKRDPASLASNGGHITLKKSWAKYFLRKMNYVKRKSTTKAGITVRDFDKIKDQFLLDIKGVKMMEEIPDELVINWDQTGIKYVPVSQWTMERKGAKRVEVQGVDDQRQITAVFGGSLTGDFLPILLVYEGTTPRCYPSTVDFPADWVITSTANHWCNEQTMLLYITKIIVPYLQEKKKTIGASPDCSSLVIFDEFKGQTTDNVLACLKENNILYVKVPANCTDRLQPLDVSTNKPAKDFLRSKFQTYAEKLSIQLDEKSSKGTPLKPVDLKLSVVKPLGGRWMIDLYNHFKLNPQIIINGFKEVGIMDILKS